MQKTSMTRLLLTIYTSFFLLPPPSFAPSFPFSFQFVVAVDVHSGQSSGTLLLFEYSYCKQGTAESWLDKSNCP